MHTSATREQPEIYTPGSFNPTDLLARLGLPKRGSELHRRLHQGFEYKFSIDLLKHLQITQKEFYSILNFAPATIKRRKGGRFTTEESDRLYRLAEIFNAAIELFEDDEERARKWLNHPVKGLGGERPVDMAITSAETEAALDLIGRLEHGVFS
jgi:putative toxin-antitoxin system antitoxin component (TIGR02293 family)